MRDLDRALVDITNIRKQLAAGTMFRGLGPAVVALTGVLALLTAAAQSIWPEALTSQPETFLACWVVTAGIAAGLIAGEMLARSRRHHGGFADAMIRSAVERFLPAAVAGVAIALVLLEFAPQTSWLLPGLWQILVALGIFACMPSLPRALGLVGAWYLAAGLGALIVASIDQSLSPWLMGLPFAVGQLLMAAILHFADGEDDDDAES